jgi:sigma-E factor negative regulatory protein RseC
MIEKARVVELKDKYARVEVRRVSACGESCASCKGGCVPTNNYVDAINGVDAKLGEFVEIEMSSRTFLNAVILTYGLPLIMLVIGIFSGSVLVNNLGIKLNSDLTGVLLGFLLMALSYLFISNKDKEYKKHGKIEFEIIKTLS